MLITGLSLTEFREIVREISESQYAGNVIVQDDAYEMSPTRFRARIRTETGRGAGARTSWTGKHYPVACWHAYRDVIAAVFQRNPKARVQTSLSVYRGAGGFLARYPQTGDQNIGSQMEPACMPDLCDCYSNDDGPYVEALIATGPHAELPARTRPARESAWQAAVHQFRLIDCVRDICPEDCGHSVYDEPTSLDAESGGRTYAGRLETNPDESSDSYGSQGAPDTDALLAEISSLIDGDPWTPPAHP